MFLIPYAISFWLHLQMSMNAKRTFSASARIALVRIHGEAMSAAVAAAICCTSENMILVSVSHLAWNLFGTYYGAVVISASVVWTSTPSKWIGNMFPTVVMWSYFWPECCRQTLYLVNGLGLPMGYFLWPCLGWSRSVCRVQIQATGKTTPQSFCLLPLWSFLEKDIVNTTYICPITLLWCHFRATWIRRFARSWLSTCPWRAKKCRTNTAQWSTQTSETAELIWRKHKG